MGKALELAPEQLDVSVRIFMTGRGRLPDQTPSMDSDESGSAYEMMPPVMEVRRPLLSFAAVQVAQGRPELNKLLKEEVSAAAGRISVTGKYPVLDFDVPMLMPRQFVEDKRLRSPVGMPSGSRSTRRCTAVLASCST